MKFKNLRTMLLVGTMAFSLALTGCGSTDEGSVNDSETVESSSIEDSEEIESSSEDNTSVVNEETDEAETDITDVEETEAEDLAWADNLYQALVNSDLDTVYEVIEADDFVDSLSAYEADDRYTLDYFEIDESNTLVVYTVKSSTLYEATIGVVPSVNISGDETPNDAVLLIYDEAVEYSAESFIDYYEDGDVLTRYATIQNLFYMNYGLEDETVVDLG